MLKVVYCEPGGVKTFNDIGWLDTKRMLCRESPREKEFFRDGIDITGSDRAGKDATNGEYYLSHKQPTNGKIIPGDLPDHLLHRVDAL